MKNNFIFKKERKFFCNSTILLVVLSISFSNIPFYTLTKLLDSYIATNNIVDRAWHLSQNENVVDKFTSYRHVVEKARIHEAHAAALQYVGAAEASGNSAAYNVSLASLTGGTGGAAQAGDLVVVATGFVSTTNGNPGVGTAGYTEVADLYQNDTRDANLSVNWKIMPATPDTLVNCLGSGSATNGAVCEVHVWRNVDQTTPLDVIPTTAQLNNSSIPNSPIITPVTSGAVVVSLGLGTGAAADAAVTAPTGYGNQADISVDPGNAATVGIASKLWSGAGAEDPAAWTGWTTTTSDSWGAVTVAIRPRNDPPTLTISQPDGTGDTVNVGDLYNITYDLSDNEEAVTVAMYYDTDAAGENGTAITGACASAAEGTGATCSWNTTGVTPGSYYVYGLTSDGVNPQVSDYSPGMITIQSVTPTLTINQTAGSKVPNRNSGDVNQYTHDTACTSAATCSAFTLTAANGTANVTSIKITESGSVVADTELSDVNLYYDTDGNWADAGAETLFGTAATFAGDQTATVSGTLPISDGTTAYIYVRYDLANGAVYPVGGDTVNFQIAAATDVVSDADETGSGTLAGTQTVKPQIIDYTNSTEAGLNYAGACTDCGARIGGGAGFRQTVVVSGYGFGSDPGLGSRDTATNKVEVVGAGTTVLADDGSANTNVSAWSNTSITIRTDSSITGNTDTDFGANFGGAGALKVTAGGQTVPTNLNFYIFPQITSVTQPAGLPADSAREYDAGDTDGVITLNGTRFGSSQGTGSVTMLGQASSVNSWSNTAIEVQVPTSIADNSYTGSVVMTQGVGGNDKTHSYNTLRILPRITSLVPATGSISDPITVNGNHLCQAGVASCPVAFDASNKVTFTAGVDATVFTSWSNTAIVTAIPAGTVTGNVTMTSSGYVSDTAVFTIASAVPSDPTDLGQYRNSGLTQVIPTGGAASTTPIYLKMTMQAGLSGGTLYPQVEYKSIGTPFVCTGTLPCASDAVEGTGIAGPGPEVGSVPISPTNDIYHWQARVKHNKNSTDYYSAWVSFVGAEPETGTDFQIDTVAPTVSFVSSGAPGTNSATITWSTALELSTSQVQWNTTGSFVNNCATNNDCTTIADTSPMVNVHSVALSNLSSGTTYYYRVRSKDAAGNETIDTTYSFVTQTVSTPAKTTKAYIGGATGVISGETTYYFKVNVPETTPNVQNAYVEVIGLVSGGTGTMTIAANGVASRAYDVNATNPTLYRFIYPITTPNSESNLNINDVDPCSNSVAPGTPPQCNKVILTPSTVSVNVLSAKIITNYSYTP